MHLIRLYAFIGCFDFSLPTDHGKDVDDELLPTIYDCCIGCFSPILVCVIGCVFGTPLMIGVALLGWSSFEFDTTQGNG